MVQRGWEIGHTCVDMSQSICIMSMSIWVMSMWITYGCIFVNMNQSNVTQMVFCRCDYSQYESSNEKQMLFCGCDSVKIKCLMWIAPPSNWWDFCCECSWPNVSLSTKTPLSQSKFLKRKSLQLKLVELVFKIRVKIPKDQKSRHVVPKVIKVFKGSTSRER